MTDFFVELVCAGYLVLAGLWLIFMCCITIKPIVWIIAFTNKPGVKFCCDIVWIIATVGMCVVSFQLYVTNGKLEFLVVSIINMIAMITRLTHAVIEHRYTLDHITNSNNFNSNYQCVETVV